MMDTDELYRRFYKPIRKWLERRCDFNGIDSDDVAQEVFVRLLRYPNANANGQWSTYLFRIAANVAENYRRLSVNAMPHASVDLLILDGLDERDGFDTIQSIPMDPGNALFNFSTPETIAINECAGRQVRAMVSTLPSRVQLSFILFVVYEQTYKEIATQLDITTRMVQRDIEHAYNKLRQVLP